MVEQHSPNFGSVDLGRDEGKKVKRVFVFLADTGSGEGVCYHRHRSGEMRPMMTADRNAVPAMNITAKKLAEMLQVDVHLVAFSERKTIDHIRPKAKARVSHGDVAAGAEAAG